MSYFTYREIKEFKNNLQPEDYVIINKNGKPREDDSPIHEKAEDFFNRFTKQIIETTTWEKEGEIRKLTKNIKEKSGWVTRDRRIKSKTNPSYKEWRTRKYWYMIHEVIDLRKDLYNLKLTVPQKEQDLKDDDGSYMEDFCLVKKDSIMLYYSIGERRGEFKLK